MATRFSKKVRTHEGNRVEDVASFLGFRVHLCLKLASDLLLVELERDSLLVSIGRNGSFRLFVIVRLLGTR